MYKRLVDANLIIRKSTFESKYQGGLEQFIKDFPNKSFREEAASVFRYSM
jgi:hypothetical protein